MMTLPAVLSVAVVVSLGLLLLTLRSRAAERRRRQLAERELDCVQHLIREITGQDWKRSTQRLAAGLVSRGLCRAAVLMAVSDAGGLELRASAYADGEPSWDPTAETAVRAARESGTVVRSAGGLMIPVLEESEVVGLLAVRGALGLSPALEVVARLAALSIAGARQAQRQMAISSTDGLTGLANHRHFQQMLGVAVGQAYLEGEPVGLILLDIDHFKSVNDTYGHLLGDLVLREIAYLLRRELPDNALAARYGGEEMVVLLSGEDAAQVINLAERIRQVIESHQVFDFTSGTRLSVTVSLGVALYQLGQGKNRLIARADEALYASKRGGRNRVSVSSAEGEAPYLFSAEGAAE